MAQLSVVRTPASRRGEALEQSRLLAAPGPPPGRYWKIDVSAIELGDRRVGEAKAAIEIDASLQAKGVVVCDLRTAEREHAALFASYEGRAVDWRSHRFTALNAAHREGGTFVYIPKGVALESTIAIRYCIEAEATFPYTLVVAGEGSRGTIITQLEGADEDALIGEVFEAIVERDAQLSIASLQCLKKPAQIFSTKRGKVGENGALHWAIAELGATLSVSDVRAAIGAPGIHSSISGIFFADGNQHIDIQSEVDHLVGNSSSETLFKGGATGRGQARFVGNIKIQPRAHGTEATLRDDALLLSKDAHIDSIPALEIGANDVKAFHGATVGAIREDEVFYAMTRGIERANAERMIAMGFFEPAITRFPAVLREQLHAAVASKIA